MHRGDGVAELDQTVHAHHGDRVRIGGADLRYRHRAGAVSKQFDLSPVLPADRREDLVAPPTCRKHCRAPWAGAAYSALPEHPRSMLYPSGTFT